MEKIKIDIRLTFLSDKKEFKAPKEKSLSIIIPAGERESLKDMMDTILKFVIKAEGKQFRQTKKQIKF